MDIRKFKRKTDQPAANAILTQWQKISDLTNFDISFRSGVADNTKEHFFGTAAMLSSAGVDLHTILGLFVKSLNAKNKLHDTFQKIYMQVESGKSFSAALQDTRKFSHFDCYSILIGENTGALPEVFKRLNIYYTAKIAQRRKIIAALSYPLVVLITTFAALFFMLKFVVPMFSDTLKQFGGELPPITLAVIYISENIGRFFIVFAVVVGVFITYMYNTRNRPSSREALGNLMLKMPLLGALIRKIHLSRFCRTMDLLLSSHVGIVESLDLSSKMTNFFPLKIAIGNIQQDIVMGQPFYKALEHHKIFDENMITLVKVGEEVSELPKVFKELSKQYEGEIDYQSGILMTVLEPLMLLFLACLIGTILIAMYLPMFKIGSVIK